MAAHDVLTWPVPEGVSDEQALAVVLQGATAWHLPRTSAHLAEGESVVVIAGAGGVGSLAVQLAKRWAPAGSSPPRPARSSARWPRSSAPTRPSTRRWTTTREPSPAPCARPTAAGRTTSCGDDRRERLRRGAVGPRAVIGFWLAHCMGRPHMMGAAMGELLPMVAEGALRPVISDRYPLSDVRAAHQDLLARRTTGELVLDPAR